MTSPLKPVKEIQVNLSEEEPMLYSDSANLCEVETKMLKRAVRRNIERLSDDFMFELTEDELENWRYQFGTSNYSKM